MLNIKHEIKEIFKWLLICAVIYTQNYALFKVLVDIEINQLLAYWSWILISPFTYYEWKFVEKII